MENETKTKKILEKTYNCGNCALIHFDHMDKYEDQKCDGLGRFDQLPVNTGLKENILKYDLRGVCEYWQERKLR